ncbi:hypothetical protein RvY_14307 [Ramazzottius varieornatus]|uniref:Uncharacterized protein n=1 Tax=Ramazzottius varieornatus TaxID=947166 RepID=A0A1D1VZB2_RAMVA|nr:hypothetical protein RvY_14307 [Ramazzottius varieornatus]
MEVRVNGMRFSQCTSSRAEDGKVDRLFNKRLILPLLSEVLTLQQVFTGTLTKSALLHVAAMKLQSTSAITVVCRPHNHSGRLLFGESTGDDVKNFWHIPHSIEERYRPTVRYSD